MKNDIKNLHNLFSDDDKVLYSAIIEKKDWINRKLIVEGNTIPVMIDGKIHYPFIENLLDRVIEFENVSYFNNILDEKYVSQCNELIKNFSVATFKKNVNLDNECPIYVEYDFSKIDEEGYKVLVANCFYKHKENDLEIDYKNIQSSALDQLKLCLIGEEDEMCLVLDKQNLIKNKFFAPIVSKIYVAKKIDDELAEELYNFAKNNDIVIEMICPKN